MSGEWVFEYKKEKEMNFLELKSYQAKLLVLSHNYEKYVSILKGCKFYKDKLPPKDNIFAKFEYFCSKHDQQCIGWYLIWNPNLEVNGDKLKSRMHNHCAPWEFQQKSKQIQAELVKDFPQFFHLTDHYDYEFPLNYYDHVEKFRSIINFPLKENQNSSEDEDGILSNEQ